MQLNTVRIIAAVVDTHNLTLYKENGDTVTIPQGDTRVRSIVDAAVPLLLKQGYADVSIAPAEDNTYVQFEAQTNGVVKLYRIAKSKLLGLMGTDISTLAEEVLPAFPMAIGAIPAAPVQGQVNMVSAVEEILQHAVSVNSPEFHEGGLHEQGNVVEDCGSTIKKHSNNDSPDTIVAVVDGQIIPGMEKIKSQFTRAAKLGSTQGVENFLKRLGSVIAERKHSVEDLLTFMERGDLPIADDGSILIYKVLNRVYGTSDKYIDCHTGKVEQWVGAYVCMDPTLVDHNRNKECSNGLHVARRGYVREFSGGVCVLAKLAPEDVIAVPEYDANKMRVCGYHIIAELSPEEYSLVKRNHPISEWYSGSNTLGNALGGHHIGKTHEVRITGHKGGGVKVTELGKATKVQTKEAAPAEALANPSKESKDTPLNPKEVVNQMKQMSRKEQAAKLVEAIETANTADSEATAVAALKAFKNASKVGWDKLGVTPEMVNYMDRDSYFKPVFVALPSKVAQLVQATHTEGSTRERIQKLMAVGIKSPGVAQSILRLKKTSKKGWAAFGVHPAMGSFIEKTAATTH